MYNLIANLINFPSQGSNSNVISVAGTLIVILSAVVIDLVYKFLRRFTKR